MSGYLCENLYHTYLTAGPFQDNPNQNNPQTD